jgi:hypothetical protein
LDLACRGHTDAGETHKLVQSARLCGQTDTSVGSAQDRKLCGASPQGQEATGASPRRRIRRPIESNGPGKNVLIRNKLLREDTGTHETLKILDDSLVDSGEETGLDPYNTGGFDRSKNWDRRFGK